MNRKERRAARKTAGPAATPMAGILTQAFRAHQAGHRSDAERLYRDVLAAEPRNADALSLLGALLHQSGQGDEAISLIRQAIAIKPRNPDYHYNLGAILNATDRAAEAIGPLTEAIALNPRYAEAHFERGNAYARGGQFENAETSLRRALDLQPGNVAIMNNLGRALRAMHRSDDAIAIWQRAATLQPDFALVHLNIGMAHHEQGRLEAAEQSLRDALAVRADFPEATQQLAAVLMAQGRAYEALAPLMDALSRSDMNEIRATFAQCVLAAHELRPEPRLRDLFRRAIEEAWARPALLAPLGLQMLKAHPVIGAAIARSAGQGRMPSSDPSVAGDAEIDACAQEPLVNAVLEAAPNTDIAVERFLTALRGSLLQQAQRGDGVSERRLTLYASLARQCFLNGYVFAETESERHRVLAMQTALDSTLRNGAPVAALSLVALGAYGPLSDLEQAAALLEQDWPPAVADLLRQQIAEPLEESALRRQMPVLVAPAGETERQEPSPRWGKAVTTLQPRPVGAVIQSVLPGIGRRVQGTATADILIAGCGTGETAIEAARLYQDATVLAVDDNAHDLAYGARRARSLDLDNISFAQAGPADLSGLGRVFDVIESGVLQRLADPWSAWSALVPLLRPGGAMRIGLFVRTGGPALTAARELARHGSYQSDAEGIRLLRQNLQRLPSDHPATAMLQSPDFFTAEACRTLYFGAEGRALAFADIEAFLGKTGLELLGVETTPALRHAFAKDFPAPSARADLSAWAVFARAHADDFVSCQLWLRKPAA